MIARGAWGGAAKHGALLPGSSFANHFTIVTIRPKLNI